MVIALAALQQAVGGISDEGVIESGADQPLDASVTIARGFTCIGAGIGQRCLDARGCIGVAGDIEVIATVQDIGAVATVQSVIAEAAQEDIIASAAAKGVVPVATGERVIECGAIQDGETDGLG